MAGSAASITVFPVVHVRDVDHALAQAEVARNAGAVGVFLINHGELSWSGLVEAARVVRSSLGGFVGINALDLSPTDVFDAFGDVADGIWVDNAEVDERSVNQPAAERIDVARAGYAGQYFGGVAFKYQRSVDDLVAAAATASRHMDVVCTSGPATGAAADLDKIATMAAAATVPLAVASGVASDNLADLARAGARYALVASSISRTWHELDPVRTQELVALAERLAG